MGDGTWGFLGVIFSVIVSWYIAHENRKIQEKLEKNQRDFQNSINKSRIEFEREMTQKQIDANLKAKARIEWINGVRDKTSELISLLLSLQKEKTVFYEQWLEIEEVSELLKLYFNSKMNEKLNSEIYVEGNEIIISQSATFIVFKENDNIDKHAYIKRYIECLVELYKEDNYKKIINNIKAYNKLLNDDIEKNFFYSLSKEDSEIATIINTPIENLDGEKYAYKARESSIIKYRKIINKLESSLKNYQKAIEDFSSVISLYLKIECDKWSAELKGNVTNAKGNVTNQGGAPFGNQNAKGNKGNSRASPPKRNKNALKTGEYETIFYETLSDEEKDIYSNLNNDPSFILSEEIRLLKIRQLRMMKRIQQAEAGLNDEEIERLQQLRKIKTPIEKDGRKLEIKRDEMQDDQVSRKTHRKIDDILSIEDSFTRIINQLAKAIKQMNELYMNEYRTDLMKAQTEKIQAEIADIGGNNSGEEVEEWKQAVLNAANKRAVRENE